MFSGESGNGANEQLIALELENHRLQDELISLHETNTDVLQRQTQSIDTDDDGLYQCNIHWRLGREWQWAFDPLYFDLVENFLLISKFSSENTRCIWLDVCKNSGIQRQN